MSNYQNGKIYAIFCGAECYYGSTTNRLSTRLSQHKTQYRLKVSKCSINTLFDKYGVEEAHIELVEEFPCENRNQLEAREGYYIRTYDCVNRCIPGRLKSESSKAYKESHKEEIKVKDANYYQANKEKIKARRMAYYETHKDEEKKKMLERHEKKKNTEEFKQYKEANREKHKAYMKEYNKKKAEAKAKTKVSDMNKMTYK